MDVNPLVVYMTVRDIKPAKYWFNQVDFMDKLVIRGFLHHEAHERAREFFLRHEEYTHILIVTDDVIAPPDYYKLIVKDYLETGYPVISGYSNWDFTHNWLNITKKDLRRTYVAFADQYGFIKPIDTILAKEYPFMKVFFVGLPFTLIRRDVVEKIPFRPYKYITDMALGIYARRGIMFDLAFAIDCANAGIPIYVDLRLFCIHYGNTRSLINLKKLDKSIDYIRAKRSLKEVLG